MARTKHLKCTCPVCGMLVMVDRFYRDHQWPRFVEVTYLGRGFDYQEIDPDPEFVEEIKKVIKDKVNKL